ncbi:MAG TPA: orotidine-5'-phosphate decarboxylase [Gemmatimonadaceae bacterium]|nr:orotidine-5'-phosphate decarboxylase [Gemmatimonadaceae bacterium]
MKEAGDSRVIVALDFADAKGALELVARLDPSRCKVKVGKELFTAAGPALVEKLVTLGFGVFLDLKFHDIPNTVASASRAAARLGVWMLNVHAAGGRRMLHAAREAIPAGPGAPKLIAVTLLTSMDAADLADVGMAGTPQEAVSRFAQLARECELDGVVCSVRETRALRSAYGDDFCLVTPGIRLSEAQAHDQQRAATPAEAIEAGASYLVIGRPITRARDPLTALERITLEIAGKMRPR